LYIVILSELSRTYLFTYSVQHESLRS